MTGRLRAWALAQPQRAAALGVALIVVVSTAFRAIVNLDATGAWIFADELIYSELGRSAFEGFAIRGAPVSGYGSIYPLLIGPAYAAFDDLVVAYQAAQVTNALLMSLTAIPVYLTARVVVGRRWSLVAAALAVAVPAMFYTSVIMTESAFYPLFALAVYIAVTALVTGSWWRQIAIVPLTALAYETRQQGIAVIAGYVLALALFALLEVHAAEAGRRLRALADLSRRYWPSLLALGVGVAGVVGLQAARGKPLSTLLGAYSVLVNPALGNEFRPRVIMAVFVQHLAEASLWLGFIPAIAFLVLLGFAVQRAGTRELRAFAAVAVGFIVVMTLIVASFAVFTNIGRIQERNLFYIGFMPLIALVWWVSGGAPRQPRWLPVALVLAVAAPASLPYAMLVGVNAASDTFGMYLPWALQTAWKEWMITPTWVVLLGMAAAALVVVAPKARSWLLVAAVVGYFAVVGVIVDYRTDRASEGALRQAISGAPNWIDRALPAGTDVAIVYPGDREPLKVWENEFFNRSLGAVYAVGVPMPAALPETGVDFDGEGVLRDNPGNPISAAYVLTDMSIELVGEAVAIDEPRRMVVLRTPPGPVRAVQRTMGVFDDGWSGGQFSFVRYGCSGGSVVAVLASDSTLRPQPVNVTPEVDGVKESPVAVPPTGEVEVRAALKPVDGACFAVFTTDQVTVPQQATGKDDTRELGVRVLELRYEP